MNFDFRDEMWLFVLGGVVMAAAAVGIALWLTGMGGASGLNLPG